MKSHAALISLALSSALAAQSAADLQVAAETSSWAVSTYAHALSSSAMSITTHVKAVDNGVRIRFSNGSPNARMQLLVGFTEARIPVNLPNSDAYLLVTDAPIQAGVIFDAAGNYELDIRLDNPELRGLHFYLQALSLDLKSGEPMLTTSGGIQVKVAERSLTPRDESGYRAGQTEIDPPVGGFEPGRGVLIPSVGGFRRDRVAAPESDRAQI